MPEDTQAILAKLEELIGEVRLARDAVVKGSIHGAPALTVEETATMLGCKRTIVFRLLRERVLTSAPRVGRQRMITTASVEALVVDGLLKPRVRGAYRPRAWKPVDPKKTNLS